jgi:hypothetical protein
MAEDLFEEEKDEAGHDDGENHAPEAECVPTTSPMPLRRVDRLHHGQRRCGKWTRREKLKLRWR